MSTQNEAVLKPATIHQLFRLQAAVRPEAVALSLGGISITYRELDAWSDRIAFTVVRSGAHRGDAVAVAIDRSVAYPAAVLGVLKAGCAYVPLDQSYPAERCDLILSDSGAVAVLVADATTGYEGWQAIMIPARDAPAAPACALPVTGEHDLAYIMLTSGSSGRPKSVLVEHGQVAALVRNDERLHVRPRDRVAMFAPLAFDASTFELWGGLCGGGELVIVEQAATSVADIGRWLRESRPHWLFLTTGLFHMMAEYDPEAFDAVGTLITGGDVLSPRHVQAVAAKGTPRVFAAYGPTETTTFASLHEIVPGRDTDSVPIGRPLRGVTMHVLDDRGQPVSPDVVGELYVGGAGVARGYHNAPALTAERFTADPLGGRFTRRYRTGDLARELPGGGFEFHGRVDRQIKVRGHRVEPGEIEVRLCAHPGVRAAVVTAVDDTAGIKRLVAYYVPAAGSEVRVADLRGWLAERLPAYMEPSIFVTVPEVPLDVNGKPDRRELPYPWTRRDDLAALPPYRKPTTPLELTIATMWADSLGLDKVGLDDDFFALGGDSLHSVDVLARLRGDGIEVSALSFFRKPTVRELSAAACGAQPDGTGAE